MARKLLIRVTAFATAMALLVLGAGVALADTVYNTLDGSVDANLEAVNFASGDTTARTVTLRLTADSSYGETDPQGGCNLGGNIHHDIWQGGKTGEAALKLAATAGDTGVATVTSPAPFTNCASHEGYQQTLTVTPVAAGSTTVTFAIDVAASKWRKNSNVQLSTASFTVNVAAATPTNTPPSVAVTGVSDGASYEIGSVPTAGCSVVDAEDTNESASPVVSALSGSLSQYGLGTQTVECSYTDGGALTRSASATYSIVDTGNPTIGHTITGTPAASGWYTSAPTVTFQCADIGGSGVASCVVDGSDPASASVTLGDGANQTVSGTATDHAGNQAFDSATGLSVDTVDPSVSVTGFVDGTTYTLGQTLPTPACDADDDTSGIDAAETDTTPSPSGTLGANGTGTLTFTCDATDNAGRTNSASKSFSIAYGGDASTGMRILQPINSDNTSVFSRGKVIPVKFKLAGDEPVGFDVTGWRIERSRVSCTNMDDGGLAAEPVAASNPAGLRYDSGADQYIQNSDFRNVDIGSCWKLRAVLDNGQTTQWSGIFKISK